MTATVAGPVPQPDPYTLAREQQRKRQRLELIDRHREQEEQRVDFRDHSRRVLEDTRKKVQEIMEDPRYPNDRVRVDEAMRVVREGQQQHIQAVADATEAYHAEVARLERLSNPAPQRGQRSTAELLERREILEQKSRVWDRTKGIGILDEYREALSRGDRLLASVIEDYGNEYIEDHARRSEFADVVYEQQRQKLPAQSKAALEQLEELVREEGSILGGMAHQKHLMAGEVDRIREARPYVTTDDPIEARRAMMAQSGGR
jgi:hypothetical protein